MAMATYLQMVDKKEIGKLRANPEWIHELDQPSDDSYRTHFCCSINYFLTGSAWPDPDESGLACILGGSESVACKTLENGAFSLLAPDEVSVLAKRLARVDLKHVRAEIENADFDRLVEEEEVDDLELLEGIEEDPADLLMGEIDELIEFYGNAADAKKGVVSYTT